RGIEGLADALGISAQKLQEVKQVAAIAEANQYSNNMVENWNVGRAVQGQGKVGVPEKMQAGLMQRVANKLKSLKAEIHEHDVPLDIQRREKMFVATLRDLPPELLEALYVSGTEFAFTPDPAIGQLDQQSGRALGFYRPATYDTSHEYGVRQIYVSARQSTEEFRENLMHECHHLIFPKVFTVDQRAEVDRLLKDGADYMRGLKTLLDDWYEAPPQMRDKIQAHIQHAYFTPQGVTMQQVMGGMSMTSFRDAIHDAVDNLDPDSLYLAKANYASPELRVAEIISRYAEMKYVRMRDFPNALNFIAPQMDEIYNNHYLPHIRERLTQMKQEQQELPDYVQNMGFPPHAIPKGEQVTELPHLKMTGHPTELISANSAEHQAKGLASQQDQLREGAGHFESKLAEMKPANERII
ncbi:MAG: hypothetical protein MRY32_06665, partial [Rickettsiales bacterium]|nr:hypothetical protein [Rickettsiales bacterium]